MLSFALLCRSRSFVVRAPLSFALLCRSRSFVVFSLLSLLSAAYPAQAQSGHSWEITYSNTPPPSTWDYDLTTGQHINGTWNPTTSGYGLSGGFRNGTVLGNVTATLTWIPAAGQTLVSDPPPSPISIIEFGYAYENSSLGTDPSNHGPAGSVSDGLGDAPVVSGNGYVSTGYHVISASPNASGVITLPQVTLSAVNPTYSQTTGYPSYTRWPTGQTSVNFLVYPVTLSLSGTTKGTNGDNILIGQGCSGSLSASPATLSNFQWTLGPVFDQFLIASDQSQGYATFLSAAALTQPNPHWHYLQDSGAGTFSVTCSATASINGTAIGTVKGQDSVKVLVPSYSCYGVSGPTGIYGRNVSTGNGDMGGGPNSVPGMLFNASVKTPAMFINPASSNAVGYSLFVQILDTNHTQWYYFSPTPLTSGSQGMALDNGWPYAPGKPADGTPLLATDSPNLNLNDGVNEFAIEDDYEMYLMYCPPENTSQYVPLHKVEWTWEADAMQNFEFGTWPAGAAGTVSITWDARWTEHPSWAKLYINQ